MNAPDPAAAAAPAPAAPAPREPHGIAPYVLQAERRIRRHFQGMGEPAGRAEAFVVGVFGEWGSGKSTVLQAIGRAVAAAPSQPAQPDAPPEATLVIDFNAWRFEREEHLLVPLLKTVQRELQARLQGLPPADPAVAPPARDRGWWARLRGPTPAPGAPPAPGPAAWLAERATLLGACTIALTRMVKLKAGLPGLGEVELDPNAALEAMQKQVDRARDLRRKAAEAGRAAADPPALQLESLYYDLFGQLQQITRGTAADGRDGRLNLVFLVDDLDRCLPEKAVQMLEAIKLFLDVEGCAFVLALDDEVIERGIAHRYRDYLRPAAADAPPQAADGDAPSRATQLQAQAPPITGHEYLEKIVQLPFRLPRWSRREVRDFVGNRWQDMLAHWNGPPQAPLDQAGQAATPDPWLLDLIVDGVPPVPRNLVRALELLEFTREVALSRGLGGRLQAYTLAQIVLLQLFAPQCYRFLRRGHAQGWRTFERRQAKDTIELASFPDKAREHFQRAPTRLDDGFFAWWIELCRLRTADPSEPADPYVGRTELPLARLLDDARRNRNGFDARNLFLQGRAGLDIDRNLDAYFSLFDEAPDAAVSGATGPAAVVTAPAAPSASVAPPAQAAPTAPATPATPPAPAEVPAATAAPRDREAFVRQMLSASPEAWQNAISREDQLAGRTLDDATFEALRTEALRLLQSRPDAAPRQLAWLEVVAPLLSPPQLRALVADTGVLAHAARRAGLLADEPAEAPPA